MREQATQKALDYQNSFLEYKELKKLIRSLHTQPEEEKRAFFARLSAEIEKINDFYLEKEEELVIRSQSLEDKIQEVLRISDSIDDSSNSIATTLHLKKDVVTLLTDLVTLEEYSSANATGLLKILKKQYKKVDHVATRSVEPTSYPSGVLLLTQLQRRILEEPFTSSGVLDELVGKLQEVFMKLEQIHCLSDDSSSQIVSDGVGDSLQTDDEWLDDAESSPDDMSSDSESCGENPCTVR